MKRHVRARGRHSSSSSCCPFVFHRPSLPADSQQASHYQLLPEQFPNCDSETTLLMWGLPPSGPFLRGGIPPPFPFFYPVWPSAGRVLFQMVLRYMLLMCIVVCSLITESYLHIGSNSLLNCLPVSSSSSLSCFEKLRHAEDSSNQDVQDETRRWRSASFPPRLSKTKRRGRLWSTSTAPVSQSGADVIFSLSGCEKKGWARLSCAYRTPHFQEYVQALEEGRRSSTILIEVDCRVLTARRQDAKFTTSTAS